MYSSAQCLTDDMIWIITIWLHNWQNHWLLKKSLLLVSENHIGIVYYKQLPILNRSFIVPYNKYFSPLSTELPSEKPTIKAEKGWYASGDSLRAQCTSPPADPPANLTWLLNGRDVSAIQSNYPFISYIPISPFLIIN